MPAGTVVKIETTGGGGWGDPLEREVENVLQDMRDGRISLAAAYEDYGVVFTGEAEAIDKVASESRRAALTVARSEPLPIIDRGFPEAALA